MSGDSEMVTRRLTPAVSLKVFARQEGKDHFGFQLWGPPAATDALMTEIRELQGIKVIHSQQRNAGPDKYYVIADIVPDDRSMTAERLADLIAEAVTPSI